MLLSSSNVLVFTTITSTCLLAAVSILWRRDRVFFESRIQKLAEEAAGQRKARIRHEIAARETKKISEAYPTLAHIKTMFPKRYGTPRQGSLARQTLGVIDIDSRVIDGASALEGLDKFSFAWLLFVFHENTNEHKNANGMDNFKAKIKPPGMLGAKTGILSTRTPHRPSRIGLSLVKIVKVEGARLTVSGVDLLDGTPIIDIKPYVPMDLPWGEGPVRYPDWVVKGSKEGDSEEEAPLEVRFEPAALKELETVYTQSEPSKLFFSTFADCHEVVTQTLRLDFRAVHHGRYGAAKSEQYEKMKLRICDFELHFVIHAPEKPGAKNILTVQQVVHE